MFQSTSMVWPLAAATLPVGHRAERHPSRAARRVTSAVSDSPAVIAGENAIRLTITIGLILVDADAEWFAMALLAGFAVVLGPPVVGSYRSRNRGGRGCTLGAAAAAGFLAYAFMFGSPILLALAGGSAAQVSALFLVLTGVRMPFVVLQAVVPQLAVALAAAADQAAAIASVSPAGDRCRDRLASLSRRCWATCSAT